MSKSSRQEAQPLLKGDNYQSPTTARHYLSFRIRTQHELPLPVEEIVAGGDDSLRNYRDLRRSFARSVHDFGKTLPHAAMVINARKFKILERRVAQIL